MKEARELESTLISGSNEIRHFHIHLMRQTLLLKLNKTSLADVKTIGCHSKPQVTRGWCCQFNLSFINSFYQRQPIIPSVYFEVCSLCGGTEWRSDGTSYLWWMQKYVHVKSAKWRGQPGFCWRIQRVLGVQYLLDCFVRTVSISILL